MNTVIGIYDDHELAVEAVRQLKEDGYPVTHLSIMGKAETEVVDEEMHVMTKSPLKVGGLAAGTGIGLTLGILTGVGVFAIPGLGLFYGAGALVGAIMGFDFGLIGGGIASFLATIGVKDENAEKYKYALMQGRYLVIAEGKEEEVARARELMHTHGTYEDLAVH